MNCFLDTLGSRKCSVHENVYQFQHVNLSISERTCPGTFDHEPIKHFCHRFINLPLAFADAVSYCKTLGAHVLVVDNKKEDTYIVNKLGSIAGNIYKICFKILY